MTDYSFKKDNESVTYVINTLRANKRKMTTWEQGFIDNIYIHFIVENKWMSEGQYIKLSDLWEKY